MRRLGLATALLRHGMSAMAEAGMTHAIVANFESNDASKATYLNAGFQPWRYVDDYSKPIG